MFYKTTLLNSTDECATLLKQANFEKNDIQLRMRLIEQQRDRSVTNNFDAQGAVDFVIAQIESHEAHIPQMAEGNERSTAEMNLLRLKVRLKNLERRAEDQSPVAQLMGKLEVAQLDAQLTVVESLIEAVTQRQAEINSLTDVRRLN